MMSQHVLQNFFFLRLLYFSNHALCYLLMCTFNISTIQLCDVEFPKRLIQETRTQTLMQERYLLKSCILYISNFFFFFWVRFMGFCNPVQNQTLVCFMNNSLGLHLFNFPAFLKPMHLCLLLPVLIVQPTAHIGRRAVNSKQDYMSINCFQFEHQNCQERLKNQ